MENFVHFVLHRSPKSTWIIFGVCGAVLTLLAILIRKRFIFHRSSNEKTELKTKFNYTLNQLQKNFSWENETWAVVARDFQTLPIVIDLPRLTRQITLTDTKGHILWRFSEPNTELVGNLPVCLHSLLLHLANHFDKNNSNLPQLIDEEFSKLTTNETFFIGYTIRSILESSPPLARLTKVLNQAFLAPSVAFMNFIVSSQGLLLSDTQEGWKILIKVPNQHQVNESESSQVNTLEKSHFTITHIRKQRTLKVLPGETEFELEWWLQVQMNQNVEPIDIAIKVKDIKFASKVPLNKQQQTRELFRLYLEEKNI